MLREFIPVRKSKQYVIPMRAIRGAAELLGKRKGGRAVRALPPDSVRFCRRTALGLQRFLDRRSRLEADRLARFDLDGLTRLRVAARLGLARADGEGAEARNSEAL